MWHDKGVLRETRADGEREREKEKASPFPFSLILNSSQAIKSQRGFLKQLLRYDCGGIFSGGKKEKSPIIFMAFKLYFMGHSQQSQTRFVCPDCLWHSDIWVMTLSHYSKMFCLFGISSEVDEFRCAPRSQTSLKKFHSVTENECFFKMKSKSLWSLHCMHSYWACELISLVCGIWQERPHYDCLHPHPL